MLALSKLARRARALVPLVALATILIVAIIVANPAPPAPVHSEPEFGQDCYCHTGEVARILINGTDVSAFVARVDAGEQFTLNVSVQFYTLSASGGDIVGWMPDLGQNSGFTFNPAQVVDNSPQDRDQSLGAIVTLFKITAPDLANSYEIALSLRGTISTITVNVGQGASLSFASIVKVDYPLASRAGKIVRMNITLRNNGSVPSTFYVYATNSSSKQAVFSKIYSEASVGDNATTTLSGSFQMPNNTLTLIIRSGHVQDNGDIDDDRMSVNILQSLSPPPIQAAPFNALSRQWAPWILIVAASLGSVPFIGLLARKEKPPLPKVQERLKLAIVDCAICGGCEVAIADLGEQVLNLLSDRIELVHAPILMSARGYGQVDVVFVVGSVRNEEDLRAVREAREKAKVLVAFGTCPGFGGLNNLSNLYSKEELLDSAYVNALSMEHDGDGKLVPSERVPRLLGEIRPLSDYVKVDVTLPGCPPPAQVIRDALDVLLRGVSSGAEVK
jgi:coenzyme F420-reducing hydrogenase gamma subunit